MGFSTRLIRLLELNQFSTNKSTLGLIDLYLRRTEDKTSVCCWKILPIAAKFFEENQDGIFTNSRRWYFVSN